MTIGFEWDEAKAKSNLQKHGVSAFDDAVTVFDDPLAITSTTLTDSEDEQRFVTIGSSRSEAPGGFLSF